MRELARWSVVVIVVAHGLIHLLGAAKGFGWAEVSALKQSIGPGMAACWLATALVVTASGVLLGVGVRWWWMVGAVAVVASQAVIFTSWGDAKAGSLANLVLVVAVIHGYAAQGAGSYRSEYHQQVRAALALSTRATTAPQVVTESDLTRLPRPVAAYVRRSGAVGKPRVTAFRARIHGRIRATSDSPWMRFTGEQVNTYGHEPRRLFFMDATKLALPVDVLHTYVGPSARMRVKLASLVPMVDARGPQMDQAETVTLFNDLCLLAPAALVDAAVDWQPVDAHHARGTFTNGDHTVSADLIFDDDGDLVDFVSDDRLRAAPDGAGFAAQQWSTPVRGYRTFEGRRLCAYGEGRWHAPAPEGEFAYLEFHLDDVCFNGDTAATIDPHSGVAGARPVATSEVPLVTPSPMDPGEAPSGPR